MTNKTNKTGVDVLAVRDYLDGTLAAQKALSCVRNGVSDPDHFYQLVRASLVAEGNQFARGFLRVLQKVWEGQHHG